MEMWLLLGVLGGFTYFIVQRSASKLTKTPIWLLWLVMMTPALIWTGWTFVYGEDTPIPPALVVGPFILFPVLYWWLIHIGRITPAESAPESPPSASPPTPDTAEQIPAREKLRPITPEEEKALRDCFPWDIFYLQNLDYRPQAILCRGKLRSVPENAYKIISENVEKVFGDRFLVLLQESLQGQPFFALVANPWEKKPDSPREKITRPVFALGLVLLTLLTTTVIGAELSGVTAESIRGNDLSPLLKGLPYSLALVFILGVHEFSHYFAAVSYKIKATLPYFIPVPFFLGTFGAFTGMRSPVPHRKALFDVAIAGPLGGFIVAVPLLIWGLSLSEVVALKSDSSILSFDNLDPRFSFLLSLLAKLALGGQLVAGKAIDLHPLAIAGYIGIIVTALNLMPVGQLDGGHIVHAMYGQKTATIVGQVARLGMFILAFIQPDFLLWAIFLLLMPATDQPALNDVTELDGKRDLFGFLALVLLLVILLPLPGVISGRLGI